MKKAIVFGSVGVNRGDDLMNRVLVNACRAAGYSVSVAAIDPDFVRDTYGVHAFNSSVRNLPRWLKEISGAECVIVGGGTLIQNDFGKKWLSGILVYAVMAIVLSVMLRVPKIVALGIGVNEVSGINRWLARLFLLVDVLLVRDIASIKNAKKLGLSNKAEKENDIGLCKSLYDDLSVKLPIPEEADYVCLSLAKEKNKERAGEIGRAVISFARENALKVKLVAMDVRPDEELDIYSDLLQEYGDCVEVLVPQTPYELLPIIDGSRLCIGMRLHFCVLSIVAGKRPVVVSREEKSEWLGDYVGRERLIRLNDPDAIEKIRGFMSLKGGGDLSEESKMRLEAVDEQLSRRVIDVISYA